MKKPKLTFDYIILSLILGILGLIFFKLPSFRIITSIFMGLSYFIWGILIHKKDKTLHLPVVLEYLSISLLSIIILIFLSLRA
ncbi:MAG: hypothetical protein ABIJ43_01550 [Candidatus Beckwithbacteria bacterium]|nr:hypothetical protein [Patescibacteria group bacterium]